MFYPVLFSIPTASMIELVPFFVCDVQLIARPLRSPFFELRVEVAFVVGGVLWFCMRVSVAIVFGAVFAACGIAFPFLVFLSSAALWPVMAAVLSLCRWWGGGT